MGQVFSIGSKKTQETPHPNPNSPNNWYGHTVQLITNLKEWATEKIISLSFKFMGWAVNLWFRWNGSPNPFDPSPSNEHSKTIDALAQQIKKTDEATTNFENQFLETKQKENNLGTTQIQEIPPFVKGSLSAQLKVDAEKGYLVIDQIEIPEKENFKTKIEFCRDLIIYSLHLSEDKGLEGKLRIETLSPETNLLFRSVGCYSFSEGSFKLPHEVAKVLSDTAFIFIFNPKGEDLILTINNLSPIFYVAKIKRSAAQYVKESNQPEIEKTIRILTDGYYKLFEGAKQYYYNVDSFNNPPDQFNPKTIMSVEGKHHLIQISYSYDAAISSISLKNITVEDFGEGNVTSRVVCYMKALWTFMTIPENSKGKIPLKTIRQVFAYSASDAKIFSLMGLVPTSKREVVSKSYQRRLDEIKKVRKESEKGADNKLKDIYKEFPEEQQHLVIEALKDVRNRNEFKTKLSQSSQIKYELLFQVFKYLIRFTVEEYYEKTKEAQHAFRSALNQSVSSLDFSSPQEFVPLNERDESRWTNAEKSLPVDLVEHVLALVEEHRLYQAEKSKV